MGKTRFSDSVILFQATAVPSYSQLSPAQSPARVKSSPISTPRSQSPRGDSFPGYSSDLDFSCPDISTQIAYSYVMAELKQLFSRRAPETIDIEEVWGEEEMVEPGMGHLSRSEGEEEQEEPPLPSFMGSSANLPNARCQSVEGSVHEVSSVASLTVLEPTEKMAALVESNEQGMGPPMLDCQQQMVVSEGAPRELESTDPVMVG